MLIPTIIAFATAFTVSLLLSPLVRHMAIRVGLLDRPDGNRKKQAEPIALGGGIVVYLSLMVVVGLLFLFPGFWTSNFQRNWADVIGYGLATTIIVLVGVLDDAIGLRGRHKLLGQMAAIICLMWAGMMVDHIGLFGYSTDLGLLQVPFTLFWMLGAINAINLLDGIDGFVTVLGVILAATIGTMAAMNGSYGVMLVAIVLCGSLLGFLRYNLPPARMYLGDAGSMLIGLMLGAIAIRANLKASGTVLLAAPLAIWSIPILDCGAAILRRKLSGRSVFMTDRGHLHHRLLEALGSNTRVLMAVSVCCLATSAGALMSVAYKNDTYAVISCLSVFAMLLATGVFGRAELRLLLSRMRSAGVSLGQPTRNNGKPLESKIQIQGTQNWDLLWETLTESTDKLRLLRLHLDVNAPAIHEAFVATWEHPDAEKMIERTWRLELPLAVADMQVGVLLVHGHCNGDCSLEEISQLLDMLDPFQTRLTTLATPDHAPVH